MRIILLLLLLGLSAATLKSQTSSDITADDLLVLEEMEDTLGLLAYTVLHDSLEENRYLACRAIIPRLVRALKTPNSFQYPFEQLQYLSIQYPPDSSFRIFTWQLFVNRDEYRYYGAIQMNTAELALFPLIDRSFEIGDGVLETADLDNENWYGSVVYDILAVEKGPQPYYLLFGADTYQAYQRRKLVDVLSFDPNSGKPRFGLPVFLEQNSEEEVVRTRSRLVQQFSAASYVTLKYDASSELIMQENLITVAGPYGEGPVNVPDGSYIGYALKKDGLWYSIPKVYTHTYGKGEMPRTPTEMMGVDRDILGRRRN